MKDFSKVMAGVFLCLIVEAIMVELSKRFSVKVGQDGLIERLRMILVFVGLASFGLERALKRRFDRKVAPLETMDDPSRGLELAQDRRFGSRTFERICSAVGTVCVGGALVSMFINAS